MHEDLLERFLYISMECGLKNIIFTLLGTGSTRDDLSRFERFWFGFSSCKPIPVNAIIYLI
jgi:hypothetical protein